MFMYGSTCFGRLSAHHQERTTALGAPGFTNGEWQLERCWSWSDNIHQLQVQQPSTYEKPEAASAVLGS
jgi:hypothetical protein